MKCPLFQFENPDVENLLLICPQGRTAKSPENNFPDTILSVHGSIGGEQELGIFVG
jgi:hypothetical protein